MSRWAVTQPDGTRWSRTFATEAAARRAMVGRCNTERDGEPKKQRWREPDGARSLTLPTRHCCILIQPDALCVMPRA